MLDGVESLEGQLAEKEQLVAALTERLEQAAEQLDRLHRTGADRSLRAGFGGFPPELVQQQQKLVDDLQRAVQQWEDLQPGAFFGRLESQLSHLRDLVENSERSGAPSSGSGHSGSGYSGSGYSGHGHSGAGRSSSEADSRGSSSSRGEETADESSDPSASPRSFLAFMNSAANPSGDRKADSTASESDASQLSSSASTAAAPEAPLPPLQDGPPAIDLVEATRDQLQSACTARDEYILYLLHRLRDSETRGHVPHSWAGLDNVPAELRTRLELLEKRLEEALRLSEVERSLERAKLARDEARVKSLDDQMQKELKRARNAAEVEDKADETPGNGRRWKRMLGRRQSDEE